MSRRRTEETHARIYDSTKALLAEQGLSVKMEEIAAAAGVGVASIYRAWETKEDLIGEVIEGMVTEAEATLRSVAMRYSDAIEAIAMANGVGFDLVTEYGQLALVAFADTLPEPYHSRFTARRAGIPPFFGHLIKRGIDQGYFPKDLDVRYCVLFWQGIVSPQAIGKMLAEYPLVEVRDKTTQTLLRTFGYRPE